MKKGPLVLLSLLLILLLAGGALTVVLHRQAAERTALEKQAALSEAIAAFPLPAAADAATEAGQVLRDAWQRVCRPEPVGEALVRGDEAEQRFRLTTLDEEALAAALPSSLEATQRELVAAADRKSDVYDGEGKLHAGLLEAAFPGLLRALLESGDHERITEETLRLRWQDGVWRRENETELQDALAGALSDPDALAEKLLAEAAAGLDYLPLHYTIDETALAGPVPDSTAYGETGDPAVIEALLQRPEAQRLIGGQELVWNAALTLFPGSQLRWYLDETILVLVWQEEEAEAVGTFSEVFIADGSQLRRKISADRIHDLHFETASAFARQTNAVLAFGGDMYYHGRMCGVGVYQRELFRFEPDSCDTCFISSQGDLLFRYRGELSSEEEAQRFIEENDVLFSLVFGPVLIDGGQDVTPDYYAWGQINEGYARAALGQMGPRHYLTMNINCGSGRYYHYATLRQAADAMLRRGCEKAYALDGGQTAVTILGGQLINPVQFGEERAVSDILYFATAVPDDDDSGSIPKADKTP